MTAPVRSWPLIRVADLSLVYGSGEQAVAALSGINLEVAAGEFLALVGPSGAGKTSLLSCLAGLVKPTAGSILVEGRDLGQLDDREASALRNRTLGMVFQSFHLDYRMRVLESVLLPAAFSPREPAGLSRRARELLAALGLEELAGRRVSALSGGQRQRVAVARALILEPALVLADEPLGNLDLATGRVICDFLLERNREAGTTVVAVTHDRLLVEAAQRVVCLEDGRLSEGPGGSGANPARGGSA